MHAGGQRDRHPQGPGDDGVRLYEEVRPCHHEALAAQQCTVGNGGVTEFL